MKYFFQGFRNSFDFSGKATIKEFWWFYSINFIIHLILGLLSGIYSENLNLIDDIELFYVSISLIPYISLGFRRLNDAGYNKYLFLIPVANLLLASMETKEKEK